MATVHYGICLVHKKRLDFIFNLHKMADLCFFLYLPGSYGLPKPWYFPFTGVYWCSGNMKHHDNDCTNLLDLCRHRNRFSVMEEDQACAMDRDPGESLMLVISRNFQMYQTGGI